MFHAPPLRLTASSLALLLTLQVSADDDADSRVKPVSEAVERITITATKQKRPVSEVAASVDVISEQEIERQLAQDIGQLVRYLPGISVNRHAGRFGLSDFTIRGLSGNRVLIEVDGVRISDQFSFGSFSNANRNFVDLDNIKSVEFIRGSASSLYGSSAIGGVVSFISKDPGDYLIDEDDYARLKSFYDSRNESHGVSVSGAAQSGAFSSLAIVSHQQARELQNDGEIDSDNASRTKNNPQQSQEQSALVKLVWQLNDAQRLRLTLENNQQETQTESYWSRTTSPTLIVQDLDGDDQQDRQRVQIDYEFEFDSAPIDAGLIQLYSQISNTRQQTEEQRFLPTTGSQRVRWRLFDFEQKTTGVEATFTSLLDLGAVNHTLTYGIEWMRHDIEELRDGSETNLSTGNVSSTILPDVFPVRDFPLSHNSEQALYWQDEIAFGSSDFKLIPALRYDRFKLNAENDSIFEGDFPNAEIHSIQHEKWSPKLGFLLPLSSSQQLYAQYAEGFRAPPMNDVNIGFENLMFGYTAIANPDLKPESSRNRELGWRWREQAIFIDVALFQNDYRDFIDSLVEVCNPRTSSDCTLITYQSQNRDRVSIDGYELRAIVDLDSLLNWHGLSLRTAYSHASGKVASDNAPLNSIEPNKWVLGLGYQGEQWGVELINTQTKKKSANDIALIGSGNSTVMPYVPASNNLIDLLLHIDISESIRFNAGIFNASDKTYYQWNDVRQQPYNDALIERYSASGRVYSANISATF